MSCAFSQLLRIAFWLVPRLEEREKLQSVIVELARRFSSPVFVPHVTVYSCRRTAQQKELSIMAGLAESCQPVTTVLHGLTCENRLTQTLFVQLPKNAEISGLFQSLHAGVSQPADYKLEPHLSLLYQKLPAYVREMLVHETPIPLQEITLDELWAVAISEQLESLDDFSGWQTLLICRLDSSPLQATIDT